MATRRVDLGPTAHTVRANIKRIRDGQRMTLKDLSARLESVGHPMSNTVLSQIETGGRRVDSDDLMAIAVALGATANALLLPPTDAQGSRVRTSGGSFDAHDLWEWASGVRPLTDRDGDKSHEGTARGTVAAGRALFERRRSMAQSLFEMRVRPGFTDDIGPNVDDDV